MWIFVVVEASYVLFLIGFAILNWYWFHKRCSLCGKRPYPNADWCRGHDAPMTFLDAMKMWLVSHKLKIVHETEFRGWVCNDRESVKGKYLYLSNRMTLAVGEDGFVEIAGSLSNKKYKIHMSDPQLFPILDRALDEEVKWIADGHRVPENETQKE